VWSAAADEFHSSHAHFAAGGAGFTVTHYAGPVTYDRTGFTIANKGLSFLNK
jgi:myosin heavy subunit